MSANTNVLKRKPEGRSIGRKGRSLSIFAISIFLSMVTVAGASTSNQWRLQFSGNAESSGMIVRRLSPKFGDAIEVSIDIEKGRSENHVAKDVVSGLKAQVGERYLVERDDGEDVLIKKHH